MKLLHLFLALFTATFFLACSSTSQALQVDTNLTAHSDDIVELHASGAKAYSWRQLSGRDVILVNANKDTASFIAPSVITQESLVFELEAVTAQIQEKKFTLKKQVSVTVLPKTTVDMNSTSGEVEPEQVNEQEQTNETNTTTETNTTQPTVNLKSLKLTLEKNSLNVDENTTLEVVANYEDNTTKDVTNEVEWNLSDTTAAQITQKSLHAKKDTNIFLQAKLGALSSNTLALEIYKEINGHKLPPMPDETLNNATLLGIDSNNNGVRDDVERWIYEEYKEKHPVHIDIAMQAGRVSSKILENSFIDTITAKEIHKEENAVVACEAYYKYYAKYFNEPLLVQEQISVGYFEVLYFNTKERKNVYKDYAKLLSGGVYTLPKINEKKSLCDFNTSKYEE